MQVSVEATSKIERRLTITVPTDQVDGAYDKRIAKIAKTATVKGFRAGKVPLDRVKQIYGATARQEALSEVIQTSLYAALDQEKLRPVSAPVVEPKAVLPGQPLEYVATIEILPEIQKVAFKLDKLEKEITILSDTDVDAVIRKLRTQHGKWKVVDRAAREQDQVLLDFAGSIDGKLFSGGEAKNYPIVLGSKMMIPGFEDKLVGVKAGDKPIIHVTFPAEYHAKEFAGKAAEFATEIKQVYEQELPELTDEFIKKLGVKSGQLDELKNEVRKNLQREIERLTQSKLKMQIFNKLIEQNPIELPKALIENEAKRIHNQLHPHHGEDHHHSEQEMAGFHAAAKKNVALGLLMGELIKQFNLTADPALVDEHIRELASVYEKPDDIISWYHKNKKARAEIEMQVLEQRAVDKLLESVSVTEKAVSYQAFMANPTQL